jgi:uncharacterized protein DUF4304
MNQDVQKLIERSATTRPRRIETNAAFDRIVNVVFVPPLKELNYKKRRLLWYRQTNEVWPIVQIQRHKTDGDYMQFCIEWGLHVPGFAPLFWPALPDTVIPGKCPLRGRSGDFSASKSDFQWMVALGKTGRVSPDPFVGDVNSEIATHLVDWVLPFLEQHLTRVAIVNQLEAVMQSKDTPIPGASSSLRPADAIAALKTL